MEERVAIGDADLCRWFATIFARELPAQAIDAYRAGAAAPFLDAVAARCDIETDRAVLERAMDDWSGLDAPVRQLATDFASLFLIPGKRAALPYASYFEEQTLFGRAHERMRARLDAAGLAVTAAENGPADHLAIMLEYLAHLLEADTSDAQILSYLEDDVLPLANSLSSRLKQQGACNDFYPSVAALLTHYLRALAAKG